MDPVFDAQYLPVKKKFAERGTEIEVAYSPDGTVDYIYVVDQLLARRDNIELLQGMLPGLDDVERDELRGLGDRQLPDGLAVLSIKDLHEGRFTVPEALDRLERLDERRRRLGEDNAGPTPGEPLATPVHVMHTAKLCAASEPGVPVGSPTQPSPPVQGNRGDQDRVRLVISDTGLLENFLPESLDVERYPWLEGVDGDHQRPDRLGRILPPDLPGIPQEGELQSIPFEAGHGTFVAGVARSMAPRASVYVGNHFTMAGAALEYEVISGLDELIPVQAPHVINLSAGTYTRKDLPLLSFSDFRQRYDIPLVAAAGNDSTCRPFWPAAFDWAIGVGAFGGDEQNLAYFSNYGDWVNVYSLGEGLINAYATGVYTYREPPKRPTQQVFRGMARWDGTSFAAAVVSGNFAAEIARGGGPAQQAWARVSQSAREIRGVGRYVAPGNTE